MTPTDHSSHTVLYQIISAIRLIIRGVTQWLLSNDFISIFLNYYHGDPPTPQRKTYEEVDSPAGALYFFNISASFNSLGCLKEPLSTFTSPMEKSTVYKGGQKRGRKCV